MNEVQEQLRRSVGHHAERAALRVINNKGPMLTEGQIYQAGHTYVKASVWTMTASLVLDGIRTVMRTVWTVATYAAVGAGGLWIALHLEQITKLLK